jgi:hypothetical protein
METKGHTGNLEFDSGRSNHVAEAWPLSAIFSMGFLRNESERNEQVRSSWDER